MDKQKKRDITIIIMLITVGVWGLIAGINISEPFLGLAVGIPVTILCAILVNWSEGGR